MNAFQSILIGDGIAAPPDHILEGVSDELAHRRVPGAPHSIYEELWHLAFWQNISAAWVDGDELAYPEHAAQGFPSASDIARENWDSLTHRFLEGARGLAAKSNDPAFLERSIRCPSVPGQPVRTMSARDQLFNLAAHNAYHLARIVLLRQLNDAWPPPSGGDAW